MDPSVNPCDDFYRFACGGFLNSTVMPNHTDIVDSLYILEEETQKKLKTIMEEAQLPKEIRPFKLVKNLYRACMNETAIEMQSLKSLYQVLKQVGGWPVLEKNSWNNSGFNAIELALNIREKGLSFNNLLDFYIAKDFKNSTHRVLQLDEGIFELSRAYLVENLNKKILDAYYKYMVDTAVVLGAERKFAEKELIASLLFEKQLVNMSSSDEKRRNISLSYNPMTISELRKNYPSISWKNYFNRLLPPSFQVYDNETVIVSNSSYIKNLENLMKSVSKRIPANYLIWGAIKNSISHLSKNVRELELAFSMITNGITEKVSRWKECVSLVSQSLPLSVGSLYIRKHFSKDAKKNVEAMVSDIRNQFYHILQNSTWMNKDEKKMALDKAMSMSYYIGYPDELLNNSKLEEFYEGLELSENNYLQNMLNLTIFDMKYSFSLFRKRVNRRDWASTTNTAFVDAIYSPTENSLEFPAGILQGHIFSNDQPKYINYGAIGFIIGHEITHGFDDQGRQFDKEGNLVNWRDPTFNKKFLEKAKCIINQYENYQVKEINMTLNGFNTQGENIADNGGVKIAYYAYLDWLKRNEPEPILPDLDWSSKQMFWISSANTWCSKYRPEMLKLLLPLEVHSVGEFRVIGSFSNMPEFSKDFNCPIGSRMNPVNKCAVW